MDTSKDPVDDLGWAPAACTLPTVEQPLRVTEFDDLFATSLRAVERPDRTTLRLSIALAAQAKAEDLAARETACCSFFEFEFARGEGDTVSMRVTVPPAYATVLDAFTARVAALSTQRPAER